MVSHASKYFVDRFYFWALRIVVHARLRKKYRAQDALIRPVKRENVLFPLRSEISQLIDCVKTVKKVPGDVAEVGVFEGATAKLIAALKGGKHLHLFDTFKGLPDVAGVDQQLFTKGQFSSTKTLTQLEKEFTGFKKVSFYKGLFPLETGHHVEDKRFSFVHLDVDVYGSTLESLEFFYPRMNQGGIILSHDYLISEGVKQAFTEFFENRSEPVIPVTGSQCLIVKCGDD